jgi:hypothetical protein
MTKIEHLLSCLGEEGSEIAQDVSKANRFGLNDVYPKQPELGTNRDRLVRELNDLLGVCRLLVVHKVLPKRWQSARLQREKMDKVCRYMRYAKKVGALK